MIFSQRYCLMTGKEKFYELIATAGGLGKIGKMPGTLGSVLAFIIAIFLPVKWWVILITVVIGTISSENYQNRTGRKDPGEVVIDEVAGTWIAMYGLPAGFALPALFLFRVVDILKPVPVCSAEKLPGGLGIMADDVIGGIMVNVILVLINWLFLRGGFSFLS